MQNKRGMDKLHTSASCSLEGDWKSGFSQTLPYLSSARREILGRADVPT